MKKIAILLLFVTVLSSLLMSGCVSTEPDPVPPPVPPRINELYDYEHGYSSPMWHGPMIMDGPSPEFKNAYLSITADSALLPIDNVTLTAYYGYDFFEGFDDIAYITSHCIYIVNKNRDIRVEENFTDDIFTSSKYKRRDTKNEDYDVTFYDITYKHSEPLTIPRELFAGKSGVISLACLGTYGDDETPCRNRITPYVNIAYRTDGETVLLVPEVYDSYIDYMPWAVRIEHYIESEEWYFKRADQQILKQYGIAYDSLTGTFVCTYDGDFSFVPVDGMESKYLLYVWDEGIILELDCYSSTQYCVAANKYRIIDCYENSQLIDELRAELS